MAAFSIFGVTAATADPAPPPAATSYAIVPQAVIGGDYTYLDLSHGASANSFGGDLGGIVPFGDNFSGQLTGAYHSIDGNHHGGSLDSYNVAGDVAWSSDMGRIGANVGYLNDSGAGVHAAFTNYGAYGEYYANDQFTLGVRGGGLSFTGSSIFGGGSKTGGYVGGEAVGYVMPDWDVQGHVEYDSIATHANQTNVGIRTEYLFSESTPIAGWVGYDYTTLSSSGFSQNSNAVSVGVSYYIGGSGTLVQRHRSGVDGWGPAAANFLF